MSELNSIKLGGRFATSILVLLMVLVLFTLISSSISIYLAVHATDSVNAIKSCTVTSGQCYRDGARRTGGAVTAINRYTSAALACSLKYTTADDIDRCAIATLSHGG